MAPELLLPEPDEFPAALVLFEFWTKPPVHSSVVVVEDKAVGTLTVTPEVFLVFTLVFVTTWDPDRLTIFVVSTLSSSSFCGSNPVASPLPNHVFLSVRKMFSSNPLVELYKKA